MNIMDYKAGFIEVWIYSHSDLCSSRGRKIQCSGPLRKLITRAGEPRMV